MPPEAGDLRPYIEEFRRIGELRTIEGADWNLEVGTITEVSSGLENPPALLFDSIKGHQKGFRILSCIFNTQRRTAISFGLPENLSGIPLVSAYRKKMKEMRPSPPREVSDGPIFENVVTKQEDIDLLKFPTPKWHKDDGGRYIGTVDAVVMKDPDEGWVNLGNYRVMIHDKNTAAVWIGPGKHGMIIQKKYWAKGLSCPVAVVCGIDPPLYSATSGSVDWGTSEYDFAAGVVGSPYKVVRGKMTDLPIPAYSEIAFEGEIPPPDVESRLEGPFGEWTGYYASGSRKEAVIHVKAVYHRNDPIITGYLLPGRTYCNGYDLPLVFSSHAWNALERAKVPGVKGAWLPEPTFRFMVVVSLKQLYAGHAKQAAFAVLANPTGGYNARFVVVVDDDIDPTNLKDVLWAMGTRCDPDSQIDVVRGCWSGPLDTMLSPRKKEAGDYTNSVAIILATKPFHWMNEFPKSSSPDPSYAQEVAKKWGLGEFLTREGAPSEHAHDPSM